MLASVSLTYLGRRRSVQIGCLLVAVGAGGMVGSQRTFAGYLVCKCINGVGLGFISASGPIWGSEAIAPSKRGLLGSLYSIGLGSGGIISSSICVGSSKLTTDWAWKTVIICQIPTAVILGCIGFLFHDSPRWLLLNGKEDEARRSFASLSGKEPYSADISWLVQDVLHHIELEREMARTTSWTEIFRGTNGKRTHIAVLVVMRNALSGIYFVAPYAALFLQNVGLKNSYTLNVAVNSGIMAGSLLGPSLCEYAGRRRTLLGGYCIMASCMLIAAATATGLGQSNHSAQQVLVAFLFLWAFTFGGASGPTVWVASAEMHSLRLRNVGQAYTAALYQVFSFGCAFWTPCMLNADYGNMGTNVGYFFFGITVVIIILTWLFVPECARLSLEQVDEHFLGGTPAWRTSLKRNKEIAADVLVAREHGKDAEA